MLQTSIASLDKHDYGCSPPATVSRCPRRCNDKRADICSRLWHSQTHAVKTHSSKVPPTEATGSDGTLATGRLPLNEQLAGLKIWKADYQEHWVPVVGELRVGRAACEQKSNHGWRGISGLRPEDFGSGLLLFAIKQKHRKEKGCNQEFFLRRCVDGIAYIICLRATHGDIWKKFAMCFLWL